MVKEQTIALHRTVESQQTQIDQLKAENIEMKEKLLKFTDVMLVVYSMQVKLDKLVQKDEERENVRSCTVPHLETTGNSSQLGTVGASLKAAAEYPQTLEPVTHVAAQHGLQLVQPSSPQGSQLQLTSIGTHQQLELQQLGMQQLESQQVCTQRQQQLELQQLESQQLEEPQRQVKAHH